MPLTISALEDIEASLAKNEAAEEKKRGTLPKHLPRIHETVAPPTNCPCCNAPMHMIGGERASGWTSFPPSTA
jgi:hypothetical protein